MLHKPRLSPYYFLRFRFLLIMALLLFQLASLSLAQSKDSTERVVEARGQAVIQSTPSSARQLAMSDAVRSAVEAVMGAYISSSSSLKTTDEYEQFQQRLLNRSDGFGRVIQVLNESQQNGIYSVRVQVAVIRPSLEKEFKAFLAGKGDPRIIVLIPESILRRSVPDPAAETEVQRALIAAGYRVVDAMQVDKLSARDALRSGGLDSETLRQVNARLKADLLVTGEAFAEEYGAVSGGLQAYSSRLELKIVDLATAQVLYSEAFTAGGVGATDAVAGKTALQNAAKLAVPELPRVLLGWLSGSGKGVGRTYAVRVRDVPSFKALNALLADLRSVAGVRNVQSRQFDDAGAQLEVEFDNSPEELAGLLEDFNLKVIGLSAGEITAQFQ